MPEILITTVTHEAGDEEEILLRERVNLSDLDSDHFCGQLVERIGWAVLDADEAERSGGAGAPASAPELRAAA